ncbi:MAG: SDR family NAD(P)-dependent oxidoreductase [Gaiellales bacterium]
MDLGLTDRVAFVAGASRGLGRATAEALVREGARVVITARGEEQLVATAQQISDANGAEVIAIPVDLTDSGACERALVTTRQQLGPVDVLVVNLGGSRGDPSSSAPEDDWDEVLELNFRVATRLARSVIPDMKEREQGAILTISSIYGREWGGAASYNASKAALIAYTKTLARELAPFGIRANSLAPGSVLFEGGSWERKQQADPEKIAAFIEAELPRGSFGRAEEIGDVAAFLCSDRASLIVGACLNVDGGQSRSLF